MLKILSDFIGGTFVTVCAFYLGYIQNNTIIKNNKFKSIILILIGGLFYSLSCSYIDNGLIKSISSFAIYTFVYMYLFKLKITKSIFLSFIHAIILLLSEVIIFVFSQYVIRIDVSIIYNNLSGSIFGNMLVCSIFIIIILLLKKPLKKLFSLKVTYNKLISLYIVLVLICIAIFFYIGFGSGLEITKITISGFAIIIFLIILFSLINQKNKNELLTKKYDGLIEFVKEYEIIIENQRIMQHENNNHLVNIKSKIIDKSKSKNIIEYIDSLLNEKVSFNKQKYAKFAYLPSNGLRGLFYYKVDKAERKDINVSINISKNIENSILYYLSNNNYKELCKIIGVYIDNAIEASEISKDKILGIEIYNRDEYVTIIISNSYSGIIDQNSVCNAGYSTKGEGRGYGLTLVKNIIDKNHIFTSDTQITDKLYIQKLIIKKLSSE